MQGLKRLRLLRLGLASTRCRCLASTAQTYTAQAAKPLTVLQRRNYRITPLLFDVKIIETPTFPDSVSEGDLTWLKAVGDAVEEDEVIGEIETDKTTLPVQAPCSGVITELLVEDGETISKGSHLAKIDVSGAGAPPAATPVASAPAPVAAAPVTAAPAVASASVNVKTPTFPDSVSEGDLRWIKEIGDVVEEDEIIGEIETDKTTLPIQAPCAGTITAFNVEDGSTVGKDAVVAVISSGGAVAAPAAAAAPAPVAASPAPAATAGLGPVPTSLGAAPAKPTAPLRTTPPPAPKAVAPKAIIIPEGELKPPGMRTESRVKMTRMRIRTGERLKEAQNTAAMLTTFNEIDMTEIMALRSKFKDDFLKKHGCKLGFMSAFAKASASALIEMPAVNAFIEDKEIVYRDYVDISIAVATPKGLVVPVIRNVETMNFADIELTLTALGQKARDGAIAIEDMDGGTFTISNGGVFGSMFGTPIINLPQSAILGMHGTQDRPVARNGKVEIRPMMYIALTYDHRLIDGREAVTFLKRVKSAVEDPGMLLLGV